MNTYRHGDVSLHPISKSDLPKGLKKVEHKGIFVLAEGEFSGHKHVLTATKPKNMEILADKDGRYYFHIKEETPLTHEEHKELKVAPGWYKMNIEREYDYFSKETERVRQVLD